MTGRVLDESSLRRSSTTHVTNQLLMAEALLESKRKQHAQTSDIISIIEKLQFRLNRPWRIAIMGEVNSGKTAAINVLLGGKKLPTQVFANTHIHTLIHYAEKTQISAVLADGETKIINPQQVGEISNIIQINVGLPYPILSHMELVDCPGTSDHTQLQRDTEIYREIDAAIWCTSGIAPLRKNEIDCWRELPPHIKKHGILLVTRKDQLDAESQKKVLGRLKYETRKRPFRDIIFISSTEALVANDNSASFQQSWQYSGARELDQCLLNLLSAMQQEREEKIKQMITRVTRYFIKRL